MPRPTRISRPLTEAEILAWPAARLHALSLANLRALARRRGYGVRYLGERGRDELLPLLEPLVREEEARRAAAAGAPA